MCTLAIYFHTSAEYPVVVAANRDEFYRRPSSAPAPLGRDPWIVAGQDAVAGGTWLGVNAYHLAAGLLNRRSSLPPDPTRRSRGLLCLDVLQQQSAPQAVEQLRRDHASRYNPFNLLLASPTAAYVLGNVSGVMVSRPLQPGLHLLTNLELNDPECPRIAKSYGLFEDARRDLEASSLDQFRSRLQTILSDHSTPLDPRSEAPPNNLCVHTQSFGTRSSTILVYAARAQRFRMWHADGPPCRTAYAEIPLPYAL